MHKANKNVAKATKGMVRTALFLKPEQTEALQALSGVTGAPIAELVRRAIDDYLEKRKAEIRRAT
jgi:predicted DNA-binding protein